MSLTLQFPAIHVDEIFKRLAAELDAGITIVTPNRRLALALKNQFDTYQISQKKVVWDSADVLPFSAWITRFYSDALYTEQITAAPTLLTSDQTQVLWETVIRSCNSSQALLAIPKTAKLAQEAWQLAHAWRLFPQLETFPANEDVNIFKEWAQHYQQLTEQACQTDNARLSDCVIKLYQQMPLQNLKTLICYGFDAVTPQQAAFLAEISTTDCEVRIAQPKFHYQPHQGDKLCTTCVDSKEEIHHASIWARARLEANNNARIGIVVPTLEKYRSHITRVFSLVMKPDVTAALPGASRQIKPFNVSLGLLLATYPLVNTIFQIMTLSGKEIDYEQVSLLLRSPFIGGSETEMNKRALLDAQLRKLAEPSITLERLLTLIKHENGDTNCPQLFDQLSRLNKFRQLNLTSEQTPSAFTRNISELLDIIGFPGERGLDSNEYQVLKKWYEVIAAFTLLDSVMPSIQYDQVIPRLRRMAMETLFQPETPEVPIQILGALEADGLEFDHLWVMGLSDEVWPMPPRPNPFLPIELQRQAKLPMSSTAESLAFSQRLTNGWLSCANEVILSYSLQSDEKDAHALKPSALIKSVPKGMLELPVYESHSEQIKQMNMLEICLGDENEQTLAKAHQNNEENKNISGGTAVIKDYAACPFRAFARHRLQIESLVIPHAGLNALERGTLVHEVLAHSWQQLETKNTLDGISFAELDKLLNNAANKAINHIRQYRPTILSGRFATIEKERLVRLAHTWLDEERKRENFTVTEIEKKHTIQIGDLTLNIRLDRVDQLANGSRIIIDYKTKKQSVTSMLGERPDEPQLPLYLLTSEPGAAALAFAQVKTGEIGFTGIAYDGDLLPAVKAFSESRQNTQYDSWEALIAAWQFNLTSLANRFATGDAKVDPKKYPQTCQYCDMQPFCRIHERMSSMPATKNNN